MLKPSLQLRLSQQLTMTPQLQQAIRLLQLPVMDLQQQIREALDQNVMLEADEPEAPTEVSEPAAEPQQEAVQTEEFGDSSEDFDATEQYAEVSAATDGWDDVHRTGPSEAPRSNEPRGTFEYAD